MKKRILSCLMALALCLTLLPTAALAEETEETAQTPTAVGQAADPANGEAKQESQPAEQEEQQEDSAAKQAVAAVQAMIDALPDAEALDGMDGEARESACFAASEAYEAYDALTEEQQSALTGAEKMIAILKWTTEQVALAAGQHCHTLCGHLKNCPDPAHGTTIHNSPVNFDTELTEALLAKENYTLSHGAYYLSSTLSPTEKIKITGTVTICLNGQTIESSATDQSVFEIADGGTLTLTDCKSNTGKVRHLNVSGIGVEVKGGTFNMYGGEITGNIASNGGGVYVWGGSKFDLYGGKISGNTATSNGGGVYVATNGEFNMRGGTIGGAAADKANKAKNGGGVYVYNSGTFTMSGGEISGNTVTYGGGGVYVASGNFTVSGTAVIENNKGANSANNNVCLSDQTITIDTEGLKLGARIGVTTIRNPDADGTIPIATGTGLNDEAAKKFFSDKGGYAVSVNESKDGLVLVKAHKHFLCGGDVCTEVGSHTDTDKVPFTVWTDALAKSQNGENKTAANSLPSTAGNYYLTSDVELDGSNHIPWMPASNTVLCLNGHKITMKGDTDVIAVNKDVNFFLTDCKGEGGVYGQITHPEGQTGGGVLVKNGGKFYMFGGSITQNKTRSDSVGGGVYVLGDFNLYGGEITGNEASEGGGVYAAGKSAFTMYGGSITGNKANRGNAKNGGGVYVGGSSTFTMNGGAKISGNWANYGGGVFVKESGKFTLSGGAKISGNTAQYNGGGVCMNAGVDGKFTMSGGTIGGTESGETNTAKNGGGVYVGGAGAITMHGGEISGNKATEYGGGVNMDAGAYGKFTMSGSAKIANNTATSGGGVFMRVNSAITMHGGEISGNEATQDGGSMEAAGGGVCVAGGTFTVSGSATVTGNKKSGGTANNVYLYSGNSITIDGTLDNGASIGVTTAGEPAEDGITIATSAQDGDENRFVSDAGYQITYEDSKVVLKASAPTPPAGHTHPICGANCSHAGNHDDVSFGIALTAKENDSGTYELYANDSKVSTFNNCYDLPAGSYYLDEDITLDNSILVMGREVDLCLNGHTITMRGNDKVVFQI